LEDVGIVSYEVLIAIDVTDLPLRGGMTADTEIIRDRREDALLVPNRAVWIDSKTGKPFVEKLVDGQTVVAFIEQGLTNEEMSEVLSGLEEGETVVIRSASIQDRFRSVVTGSMTGSSSE
jgi:multidrug efflux pump subunit AcrA (membrane-fusion protein)